MLDALPNILGELDTLQTSADLSDMLGALCAAMGFDYFALTHHFDVALDGTTAVRLHNYPERFVRFFDEARLGISDPVHRASHVTHTGFLWSEVPDMIMLTRRDRAVLAHARNEGIADGFTVPAHVPGELSGSCSFAMTPDATMRPDQLPVAQLIGSIAFEKARRLSQVRPRMIRSGPPLTDRQRDCVLWAARGKTDVEIGIILSIGTETVRSHLKEARDRYDVTNRAILAVLALYDGLISFTDIFRR